jgi:Tfp pilus assembly protein PilV
MRYINTSARQVSLERGPKQQSEGFTILETCIAMVIMLIAVLGSVSVFAYSIKNNSGANDRELAMAVAQQQLEALRSVSFTDASLNDVADATFDTTRAGRSYSVRKTVVSSNLVNGQPTLKTITIQVTPAGSALGAVALTTVRTTLLNGPNR